MSIFLRKTTIIMVTTTFSATIMLATTIFSSRSNFSPIHINRQHHKLKYFQVKKKKKYLKCAVHDQHFNYNILKGYRRWECPTAPSMLSCHSATMWTVCSLWRLLQLQLQQWSIRFGVKGEHESTKILYTCLGFKVWIMQLFREWQYEKLYICYNIFNTWVCI